MLYHHFVRSILLPIGAMGATIAKRQDSSNTAVVNLATTRGTPQHLAAGVLYGIPDTEGQISDSFYTDMGFNYARVGGAQLDGRGWIYGIDAYNARFQSTLSNYQTARTIRRLELSDGSNYQTARKYDAPVIILPHDIWGTDHANSSTVWPGDNGDWTDYDDFLDRLFSDIKANDMLDGLVFDIWNEPDGSGFWARTQSQYLDLYVRTHQRIRSDSTFNAILISGPSSAGQPSSSNNWFTTWLQTVVDNNVIPDQYAWHDEPGDVANDVPNFNALLQQYGAPSRPININEYATFDQQTSAGAAWWISRLERYDLIGLRGNSLSGCQLHNFLESLLTKTDTSDCTGGGYAPNGEYQVYKYYSTNMTGVRATTFTSGDGTWYLTIDGLSSVGLPTAGSLTIQTWSFDDAGHFGEVDGPSDRGTYAHTYSGDSVTFPVYQTSADANTAWAF